MSLLPKLTRASIVSSISNHLASRLRICSTDPLTRFLFSTSKSGGDVPAQLSSATPPKRPPSPFLVYAANQRQKVSVQYPDMKSNDVLRRVSEEWKALPVDVKKEFVDTFVQKMETFKEEEKKWWQSLSKEQKEEFVRNKKLRSFKRAERRLKLKKRTLGQPVKARTAFNFYVSDNFKGDEIESDVASQRNRFSAISESWNKLTEEEKKVFHNRAEKDRERYLGEMNAWELQMMRSGHSDVVRQSTAKPVLPTKRRSDIKEPQMKPAAKK